MRYDVLLCDADDTLFNFTKAEENAFDAWEREKQMKAIRKRL